MATKYVFADEAGCFTFNRDHNVSKYFIICTVTLEDLTVSTAMTELRHALIEAKIDVGDCFHATSDKQDVRDAVYAEIMKHEFTVQATVCEKSKAQPHIAASKARFYKYPWFYQFKFGMVPRIKSTDRLVVTAASIGTKKERATFTSQLDDVMRQTARAKSWLVDFRPAQCDPCLQLADYCAWAIQRKWERDDARSYDIIRSRITYEYDLWRKGTNHYY